MTDEDYRHTLTRYYGILELGNVLEDMLFDIERAQVPDRDTVHNAEIVYDVLEAKFPLHPILDRAKKSIQVAKVETESHDY